ncbi:uncharacterized protein PITG_11011 [Phytophthora infestans T30-4]|uniref:RING-type domain-containing protein n=1 Tax=Phytophthora infestans (strain T30-4) TaxID=403677 RepID=D0NFZ0_PHYIT|nr:uncharacterized protein PITG_11011 [Phytophthora infestans T30-4]EEY57191.1 conserved hypothetical protein [Phytophthora infestans T30-4]|eukprot:XP_002901801.1 conserved hypothetical protein [Phytophthora infestans T30-4]
MIPASVPAAQPLPQTAADIPQRSYVPLKDPKTGMDTTNAQCARCHKGLFEKDIIKQPQCGHLFHGHCIDNHLRTEIYCPVCRMQVLFPPMAATVVHDGRAVGSVYPSTQLPPRAVPVATAFTFYRDPAKVRPETNGWYRCPRCAQTDIVDFIRGSCVLQ